MGKLKLIPVKLSVLIRKDYWLGYRIRTQMLLIRSFLILAVLGLFLTARLQGHEIRNLNRQNWEIGLGAYHFTYREPGGDSETGCMTGGQASYTGWKNNSFWKAEATYYGGMPCTQMQDWNSNDIKAINDDHIKEFRFLMGGESSGDKRNLYRFSAGLGYRYWYKSPKDSLLFVKHITYFYTPVVLEVIGKGDKLGRKFKIEGDWLWSGQVKSIPVSLAGYNQPVNRLKTGYGLRCSYDLTKNVGKKYEFVCQPAVEYWNISRSNSSDLTSNGVRVMNFSQPQNYTLSFGFNFNWNF